MCHWNGDRDRTPCLDPVIGHYIQTILTNVTMSGCRKKERRERKSLTYRSNFFISFHVDCRHTYVFLCKKICYAFPDHFHSFSTASTICLILSYSSSGVVARTSFSVKAAISKRSTSLVRISENMLKITYDVY
jgi:hypothetical protein